MPRFRRLLLLSAFLGCLSAAAPAVSQAETTGPCLPGGEAPRCIFWTGKVPTGGVGDGDTLTVNYEGKSDRVRITGIQAMEMTRYSTIRNRRRGDCHSVAATNRLEDLVREAKGRVRISAQDRRSSAGHRIRRSLAVLINGKWRDAGQTLVAEGHALWLPGATENAWNPTYSRLSQRAGTLGRRLWDRDSCGSGPAAPASVSMSLNPDAQGNDGENVNGEFAILRNNATKPLSLRGWWFRDSALRRYVFPAETTVPARGSIRLRMGKGQRSAFEYFWGQDSPPFENGGDGGYLFDPQGDLRAWVVYPCRFEC